MAAVSIFPSGFDPRADAVFALMLAELDTPDGVFRFMLGADGVFRDLDGRAWIGSTLLRPGEDEFAINGTAPGGSVGLTYFQDPAAPDLVAQLRALGADYVTGREVRFFVQPLGAVADFYAPKLAPVQIMARTVRRLSWRMSGAQDREILLEYESAFEARKRARRMVYNVEDHARLTGAANPSLRYMPTQDYQEQKLFG